VTLLTVEVVAPAGVELTYVNPGGRGSCTTPPVVVVCELFVTTIVNLTLSPRLAFVMGVFVPSLERETFFETVSAAVLTLTPVGSVAVSVPTLVNHDDVLKNVPLEVPAFTRTTNETEELAGIVVPPGKFHVTVLVPETEVGVARLLIEDVAVAVVPEGGGAIETLGAVL
jgi:hypothetical protein